MTVSDLLIINVIMTNMETWKTIIRAVFQRGMGISL